MSQNRSGRSAARCCCASSTRLTDCRSFSGIQTCRTTQGGVRSGAVARHFRVGGLRARAAPRWPLPDAPGQQAAQATGRRQCVQRIGGDCVKGCDRLTAGNTQFGGVQLRRRENGGAKTCWRGRRTQGTLNTHSGPRPAAARPACCARSRQRPRPGPHPSAPGGSGQRLTLPRARAGARGRARPRQSQRARRRAVAARALGAQAQE